MQVKKVVERVSGMCCSCVTGIGKTTVIKKTCEVLKSRRIPVQGFYTEECREGSQRIGFDVITLTGDRQPLARLGSVSSLTGEEL